MITIWKLENNSWSLIGNFDGTMEELAFELEALRAGGSEYRAEKSDGGFSSILGV